MARASCIYRDDLRHECFVTRYTHRRVNSVCDALPRNLLQLILGIVSVEETAPHR